MKIIRGFTEDLFLDNVFLTIGVFDGVHVGHKRVLKALLRDSSNQKGNTVVLTFHPHPLRVLQPRNYPPQITCTGHKLQLLADMGVDYCFLISFDEKFARLSPEQFVAMLCKQFEIKQISLGYDSSFGKDGKGTLDYLTRIGTEKHFLVKKVGPERMDDLIISSTLIRKLVISGEFDPVSVMLGRKYSLWGTVVTGETVGREIGYPTANIDPHHEAIPPSGVYIVEAILSDKKYPGILNIGHRPTFSGRNSLKETVEVHLLDFDQDIYGQDMEIIFIKKIRDEKRFPDRDSLVTQIRLDEKNSRDYFKNK